MVTHPVVAGPLPGCRNFVVFLFVLLSALALPGRTRPAPSASPAAPPPPPGWKRLASIRKTHGNISFHAAWDPAGGVRLLFVETAAPHRQTRIEITATSARALQLGPVHPGQWQPLTPVFTRLHNTPKQPLANAAFLVKLRENDWQVYIQDRFVCKIPSPFAPPGRAYVPAAFKTGHARFQPTGDEYFHSDFMIEKGAPNPLYPWKPQSGKWKIHTAQEDALASPESNLPRVKKVPLTPDKSPNFYSLAAIGHNCLITTGYNFYDEYEYAAAVQVNDGEAGIVFYHRDNRNYYAFTLTIHPRPNEGGVLTLWRMRDGTKTVLARIATPLYTREWYQPKVKVGTGRIECYLDHVKVAGISESLPPGGKIGLFADSAKQVRFDDVKLDAIDELHLRDVEHVRFYTLMQQGRFYHDKSFWHRATPPTQLDLRPPRSDQDQELIFGRPDHRGVVFSAEFLPRDSAFTIGLVAGFRGPDRTYFRFRYARSLDGETFALLQVRRHRQVALLDAWAHPLPSAGKSPHRVRLMADASTPGELRLYRNGELVLIHLLPDRSSKLPGAAGLYVAAGTRTVIQNLDYRFHRRDVFKEKQETNKIFRNDPFMRNWSSPEGQWVTLPDGHTWHKSDFFGRFDIRLPCVPNAELHVGVPENTDKGRVHVRVRPGALQFWIGTDPKHPRFAKTVPIQPPKGKPQQTLDFRLFYEGWWTWLTVDGRVRVRTRLDSPLRGTRVWVSGFSVPDLARSRVERYHVKDDLFSESPYDWISQGGDWRIINRFQCTPSWSHMIGESHTGLAAFWQKYVYSGDFTLEFYAGIRHGWYERPGDLNCTAMAQTTVPGSGYTITCTEYDPNLSENWTTLYRNGKPIMRSDKYLIPRRRKGYVRKYRSPLIAAGRPIHGAWYYFKLRRIGHTVEYFFDNQLVFRWQDPNPIPAGLMGIWTFRQAMTVARVKVSFRHIRPRTFPFHRLPVAGPTPPARSVSRSKPAAPVVLGKTDFPLEPLAPKFWKVDDDAGHARLLTATTATGRTLGLQTQLGAGNMFLESSLPALPLAHLAGWEFDIKRTPSASLNVHYSIGRLDRKGRFKPYRYFYHRINGFDFSDGNYQRSGQTQAPAVSRREWKHPARGWRHVIVWIPTRYRGSLRHDETMYAHLDGFGHRQPSYYMAGLFGDFPGAAYMVRGLTPIFYTAPPLHASGAAGAKPSPIYRLQENPAPTAPALFQSPNLDQITDFLARKVPAPGLHRIWLKISGPGAARKILHPLAWIRLPAKISFTFAWAAERPESIRLGNPAPYPDPRFAEAWVQAETARIPLRAENRELRIGLLPRIPQLTAAAAPLIHFRVNPGTGTVDRTLAWKDAPVAKDRPVLETLGDAAPFFLGFEQDALPRRLRERAANRIQRRCCDPLQGAYLEVQNHALGERLHSEFRLGFSLARFPLFQFRYRAGDMDNISAVFAGAGYVRLGDDLDTAVPVRFGHDLRWDETWHTWIGFVPDAFRKTPFSTQRFLPNRLALASAGSPDQTGRYSRIDLDDLEFGPAVHAPEQLACSPVYFDRFGLARILTAVIPGPTPFSARPPKERTAVHWQVHSAGKRIVPQFSPGLPDGPHHLLIKAVNNRGIESTVTDLPFLLDRKPLRVSWKIRPDSNPASNGVALEIRLANDAAAPWQVAQARFTTNGRSLSIPAWTNRYIHSPNAETVFLDYPLLLRSDLDRARNGDTLNIVLTHILDGAGNPTPDQTIPIKIDYKTDKTGPAWYDIALGKACLWFFNWDGVYEKTQKLSIGRRNTAEVRHPAGGSPFFRTATYYSTGDAYIPLAWKPLEYPWIAFRMRIPVFHARTRISLVLDTNEGTYTFSLKHPSRGNRELNRTQDFRWFGNRWKRFCLNIPAGFRAAGMSSDQLRKLTVKTVYFRRRNARHRETLDLDDIYIFTTRAPADQDYLAWRAFDASGVAGIVVTCLDKDNHTAWTRKFPRGNVPLHSLRPQAPAGAWLQFRAEDKAGNLSAPFWLPLPR